MEQIAVFEDKVMLTPADLSREITSFDDILLQKLKSSLEGKCSRHGYVLPDTLELLSRSMGSAEKGRFTSDFLYYIKAQGKVLNPPDGFQIEGEVARKNKMGLYVIINNAIRIMIPRDLHIGNEDFDAIQIGDIVRVEIKKSRFQVNDTHILSIGQYLQTVHSVGSSGPEGAHGQADAKGAEEDSSGTAAPEEQEEQEEQEQAEATVSEADEAEAEEA